FNRIKRKVETRLTNIELKGFTRREQLIQSMKMSKFVLIPSFYEACPMILLESMCLGKIPIMFDLPYAREFTANGKYGILAKNLNDMVFQINRIIQEPEYMRCLEGKIKHYARKNYNINKAAQKYYHLYKSVV
ncbi:MAG: glycosyltransferase, partial [Fervidobacterium sp.]